MQLTNKQLCFIAVVLVIVSFIAGATTGVFFIKNTPLVTRLMQRDTTTKITHIARVDSFPVHRYVTEMPPRFVNIDSLRRVIKKSMKKDTIRERDTVFQDKYIYLPQERKYYANDNYKLCISGYDPRLVFIEVYNKEKIRTITNTIFRSPGSQISLNAGVSTLYYKGCVSPSLHLEFFYQREHLTTYTRAGVMYINNKTMPFVAAGTSIQILKRKF